MVRTRLLLALSVVLAGLSLLPFVGLASERFGWELYTGAYEPKPRLTINYSSGQPGSYFTLTGSDFAGTVTATVSVNGHQLGTVSTDEEGGLAFSLSTVNADPGVYFVKAAVNPSASVRVWLDPSEPYRPPEGTSGLTLFDVPSGIAYTNAAYLPLVLR